MAASVGVFSTLSPYSHKGARYETVWVWKHVIQYCRRDFLMAQKTKTKQMASEQLSLSLDKRGCHMKIGTWDSQGSCDVQT